MSSAEFAIYEARRAKPALRPADAEPNESDLHAKIFNECRRRGWIPFHGAMSERTHRTLGEPDFTILADSGRSLMVECKARDGKLSLEQHAMIVHAKKLGHEIHVVWSFNQFLNLITTQCPHLNKPENT